MQQIVNKLPNEHIVYFGDTARLPYGNKSRETIIRYMIENSIFLMEQDIKILVIACNTASAHSLDKLKQIFNIPIIEVIKPGSKKAVEVTKNGHIAVLATKGTVSTGVYQKEILRQLPEAHVVPIACPLFVPLLEESMSTHAVTKIIVQEYLAPLKKHKIDTLLLGCTHYPLLRSIIQEELGDKITIVDSAQTCAEEVASILEAKNLNNVSQPHMHKYFVSDDPEKFRILGKEFLGMPLEGVELRM